MNAAPNTLAEFYEQYPETELSSLDDMRADAVEKAKAIDALLPAIETAIAEYKDTLVVLRKEVRAVHESNDRRFTGSFLDDASRHVLAALKSFPTLAKAFGAVAGREPVSLAAQHDDIGRRLDLLKRGLLEAKQFEAAVEAEGGQPAHDELPPYGAISHPRAIAVVDNFDPFKPLEGKDG